MQKKVEEMQRQVEQLKKQKSDTEWKISQLSEVVNIMEFTKTGEERINIRLILYSYIRNMIKKIKIYPPQRGYKEFEWIELDICPYMDSKFIVKIVVRFKGAENDLQICD